MKGETDNRGSSAISTGNDIVALDAIDWERTKEPRFYSRILAPYEQELYLRLESPGLPFEHFVWLLWSIKESVYKYRQRMQPGLAFSPTRIVIQQIDPPLPHEPLLPGFYCSTVHAGSAVFYSRSSIRAGSIATVVSPKLNFEGVRWGLAAIDRSDRAGQSAAVRALALSKLRAHLFRGEDADPDGSVRQHHDETLDADGGHDLHIVKTPSGCPLLMRGMEKMDIPVSLAHHGRFVAYSFYSAICAPSRDAV